MRLRLLIIVIFSFLSAGSYSQDLKKSSFLLPEEFVSIVRKYHPVIRQADIDIQIAGMGILYARGAFDPYFYFSSDQKKFDGKTYYQYSNPEIKIPTWYGVELKAGIENNLGERLNSEYTFGQSSYASVSVPLAKNLVLDKRRAALQQAKIFRQQTYSQRAVVVNDLLDESLQAYWNWVKAISVNNILINAVAVNEKRYELIKKSYEIGERPAIDTTEAIAQLQSFQYLQSESELKVKNAAVELSNYLWKDNNEYYELPAGITISDEWSKFNADTLTDPVLNTLISSSLANHPKLRAFRDKMSILEINRNLKFQDLLPVVNVRASILNKGYNVLNEIKTSGFYADNNKFGIDIGIPLRLSEGRAAYRTSKLKIQETNFEIMLQKQQIENKIKYYFNEMLTYKQQIKLYEQTYENYRKLFQGEEIKFTAGESSLFILNSRENKVLEAAQKLTELKVKYFQSRVSLLWAAGELR